MIGDIRCPAPVLWIMVSLALLYLCQSPIPKFQDPPGIETNEVRLQIDLAGEEALSGGVSSVLANANYDSVRTYSRFRDAIKKAADARPVTMISPMEPGKKLKLTFDIGVPGQLIYVYHTDARGAYGANGVHISGNSGDFKYARLFAYGKTGSDGTATFHTIRPAGYPDGELPQHVHFNLEPRRATVGEIWFSDDPRITPAMRERGKNEALIVPVKRVGNGWEATAKITLRTERP